MKTKATHNTILPEGFTIKPELNSKYSNDPVFVAKAEKMKKLLEKAPIPAHILVAANKCCVHYSKTALLLKSMAVSIIHC